MPKFIVYRDTKNKWRWQLESENGRIIADSAESYSRKRDALKGIRIVSSGPYDIEFLE